MEAAVKAAVSGVQQFSEENASALNEAVTGFFADRVRRWLTDVVGVSGDTADAVMAVGWSRLPDAVARAEALEQVREADSFRSLALAFKRVRNITEDQPDAEVDAGLFRQPEENELHEATVGFRSALERFMPERQVVEAFSAMEPLADVLERFFVEVLVMCDEDELRSNRIAILKQLGREFSTLADLSKLQVEGGEE
jgi:glycyl-tRNA synthetase beta chain